MISDSNDVLQAMSSTSDLFSEKKQTVRKMLRKLSTSKTKYIKVFAVILSLYSKNINVNAPGNPQINGLSVVYFA